MRRHRGYHYSHTTHAAVAIYGIGILICVITLGLCIFRPFNKVANRREVTVTVTDKVVKNSNSDSKYLVFTEDNEGNIATYEITDSLFAVRFDSSDTYAAIKVGKTYRFEIGGSRNRLLSWYPNIYEYELIE